jgi:uncharacterized protein YsxB (DUF464 family)
MIKAIFKDNNKTLSLTVTGHAEYADKGEDIVCAAASILAYTLAEHLAVLSERGHIDKPDLKMESGDCSVSCVADDKTYGYLKDKFVFVQMGMEIISNTYPECVSVQKFWDSDKE